VVESSLEDEVVALVARHVGAPAADITLSSRLFHDVGVDGDDAVELVAAFESRFGPDLTPLWTHWGRHFGPEAWPARVRVRILGGIATAFVVSVAVIPFGIHPAWVWAAAAAAGLAWFVHEARMADPLVPVTVGHLVEAARSGRWPISYGEDP
jgi:acyl carrier protein